jgi:hypothetical protein
MRRAARVDANQADIVEALLNVGCSVWVIGLPLDLLVGVNGKTALVEVKTMVGKRNPKAARYTRLQQDFMQNWRGGIVATVTDVDGALRVVATMSDQLEQRIEPPEPAARIDSLGLLSLEGL